MKYSLPICVAVAILMLLSGRYQNIAAKEFNYQTLHEITFTIHVYDELKKPLRQAVIRVTTEQNDVTNAVTSENGAAAFKISVPSAVEFVSLIVEHPGCATKTVDIGSLQEHAVVRKSVYLGIDSGMRRKADRDSDGVPDEADEFPDDPYLIGTVHGEYTIVYENGAPGKTDADYNDCAVRLDIREYIDNNNMISRIVVGSRVLAAGAGHPSEFRIKILDEDYRLIMDPLKDLGGSWNTRRGEKYIEGSWHTFEVPLEAPVARDAIEPMPYDPYIVCGGDRARQAHLPFVKTTLAGSARMEGAIPSAILVPFDWAWPYESTAIETAYPDFRQWRESKGAEQGDWYLHPDMDHVYKVSPATMLTAYLMKASLSPNSGIVLGILAAMTLAVSGMNLLKKRRASQQREVEHGSARKTNIAV